MSLCYWPLVSTSSRVAFGYVASTLRLYPALLGQAPLISGDRMACYTLPPTTKHAPGRTRVPSQLLFVVQNRNHQSCIARSEGGWRWTGACQPRSCDGVARGPGPRRRDTTETRGRSIVRRPTVTTRHVQVVVVCIFLFCRYNGMMIIEDHVKARVMRVQMHAYDLPRLSVRPRNRMCFRWCLVHSSRERQR